MLRRFGVALWVCLAALLAWGRAEAAGPKIGLLTASSTATVTADVKAKLEGLKVFDSVTVIDASAAAPALATLKMYDAILLFTTSSSSIAFGDAIGTGDNLAKYLDDGGGVVVMNWWQYYSSGSVRGAFMTKYNLTDPGFNYGAAAVTMGMKIDAAHPILSGINTVTNVSSSYCYLISGLNAGPFRNGAKHIATWSNGNAMVLVGDPAGATKRRVDLNMGISSQDVVSYGCWDPKSDAAKLIGQSLLFVANPLRATPSSVDFGDVGVMTSSAPQTVVVQNGGSTPVVLSSGVVSPAGEFTVTLNGGASYPITLNAGDSFSFDVRLRPSATGVRQGAYTMTPMAGMGATDLSVSFKGNGIGPRFAALPASLDFGGIKFNGAGMTMSAPQNVQIKNVGGGQVRINTITLSDRSNFSLDTLGVMLPNVLVGGAATSLEVKFTPQAKGRFTATVDVGYDLVGGASGLTASIPVVGTAGDPQIQLPAANITLQSVRVNKTGPTEYITVTNVGLARLSITGLMISGTNPGDFTVESTATMMNPLIVGPNGAQGDILVHFNPTMAGLRRATLTILNDDPDPGRSRSTVNLSAVGTVANFAISPTALDFSKDAMGGKVTQQTGTCSTSKNVEITNSGDDALTVSSISFTGTGAGSFRHTLGVGTKQVPPNNGKLIIPVQFCPTSIGTLTANLVVATDYMAGHMATVSLTGIGTGPKVTATPGTIDFGPVYINTTSQVLDIVLKNEGDQELKILKTVLPAKPFTITNVPADNTSVAPGMSVTLKATVNPTESKVVTDVLTILVNDQIVMGQLKIPLAVTGVQANITVQPKQMTFATTGIGVKSADQTLSVLNSGAAPLTGISISISGANSSDFGYSGEVPMSIEPGKTASFKVYFKPQANGMRTATLVLRATGLQAAEQVVLTGTGKAISVSCSPDLLDYGLHEIGTMVTKQVLCTNMDKDPVEVDLSFTENQMDWNFSADGTAIPGAANGDDGLLPIKITFTPTDIGPRTSTLIIKSKDSGIVIGSVDVDGTGAPMKMEMPGGNCGCRVGGTSRGTPAAGAIFLLLGLGALIRRRRRG